jgi:DNA-binding transcriptional MerR regulator
MKRVKKISNDRNAMIKLFTDVGYTQKEIDEYYRHKDNKVKQKAEKNKQNKKLDKKRKPIIFYGYNTVQK